MKPLPHHYHVQLSGGPTGHATVSADGIPDLASAPPLDFDGPGDAWSPEHLLLGSIATCYLFTLRAVAANSGVDFVDLELAAEGMVDRADGAIRFTGIVLRPRVRLATGTDAVRAGRILDKAERACLVSASLAFPVRVEARILPPED
jgi:peroxiredoxin-like protein